MDDFQAAALVNRILDHDNYIEFLHNKLICLENKFGDNKKIASTLCNVLEDSKPLDTCIRNILIESLKNDVNTQEIIRTIIWKNWKVIGSLLLAIILAVIGGGYFFK